ncbi:MAG: U32 family peptidase [Ruminococcaceae bacterium]|nr:U32 family peptidase [Oscillospiraceae bacterium]
MSPDLYLPELLAPAGSPEALYAAMGAGADAVYLGGTHLNARMNAHNFDKAALSEGVSFAHKGGGRVYLTLNTLVYDRELTEALDAAYEAAACGVDGLIVADVGAALAIHKALPSLPLHASTQASAHNALGGQALARRGFCRYVLAREASLEDMQAAVRNSGMEVEVFAHGALCVSHSGQCLFSSVVGGRSGNRGLCAQPCRLPYTAKGIKGKPSNEYPLSLKDLSLARHIPALIDAGVASLKIEGRMKSPEYVGGVVSVFRKLLDEGRGATDEEMSYLAELFSRDGFTDGYFCQCISPNMLGMRSEEAKTVTAKAEKQVRTDKAAGYLPLDMHILAKENTPLTLTATAPLFRRGGECNQEITVTMTGDSPDTALNRPTDRETLEKQLSRLGGSDYTFNRLTAELGDGLMIPVSKLNALRRNAVEALDKARKQAMDRVVTQRNEAHIQADPLSVEPPPSVTSPVRHTARFRRPAQIPPEAERFFDLIYLPMDTWQPPKEGQAPRGVILPPVVFDRELEGVKKVIISLLEQGARHFLLSNEGHLPLMEEILAENPQADPQATVFHGDFRLNVGNRLSAAHLLAHGYEDLILSPELTQPKLRDLCGLSSRAAGAVVYGRMPLMLLEKCLITALYPTGKIKKDNPLPYGRCGEACEICRTDRAAMVDRRGMTFPVLREYPHRNLVVNSLPLSMTDKGDVLDRLGVIQRHYIFTVETPEEIKAVIKAAKEGAPLNCEVRRMPK